MLLNSIKVRGIRNLHDCEINFGSRFNVLSGDNGQGKTNLLEAIYASCALRSFRTSRLKDLISIHHEQAYVSSWVTREELQRQYELTISQRSRIVRLDGKTVRPLKKYFGSFQVVLFAPEDLSIPKGSPSHRRKFLDRGVFTLQTSFLEYAQNYEKTLKSRNKVLKDEIPNHQKGDLLDVYDQQLIQLGAEIVHARLCFLDELAPYFEERFESITQSNMRVRLSYESEQLFESHKMEDIVQTLRDGIKSSRPRDLARGQTLVGPHRDDFRFYLEEQSAATFASQGQLRAMILAWKNAEMQLIKMRCGHPPILLLDDVSSELDRAKNEQFFSLLNQNEQQCFITTTHSDYVKLDQDRVDFRISGGQIQKVD